MAYDAIDFEKICRTCLAETTDSKGLFSVQYINEENLTLSELLRACTSLEIQENDGLPKQVCLQCIHYILSSFSFQQQCHKSDSTLKALISGALQTQFIQLKHLDSHTEVSSTEINEILNNTSLQDDTLQNTLNNQDSEKNFTNDIGNLDTEPLSEDLQTKNRINNILVSKDTESLVNDAENIEDFDIKLVPSSHINKSEIKTDLLDINTQENEAKTEYQIDNNDLKEIKFEAQKIQEDETAQPLFPCEYRDCIACFTTENDLKRHTKTHRPAHFCEPCNRIFSSASTLSRHVSSKHQEGKKVHLCNECGKGFGRSDDLKRHLRVHTGEKPFSCKICGKAFAQSFRLLEHMRAHANEKNFVCAVCGKAFSRYTSLLAHNKTHSGIKSHECKECGKKLCSSASLTMHMKIHTGERNYLCNFCGKGFTCPSNLTTHRRMHTGEKPYVCKTCGKGFADQSRLQVHNRVHSGEKPYVCSFCDRGCVSSSQLKKHIRIHTGEKPYECELCDKRFYRGEDLKMHIKVHKGERNHTCGVCQKGFYQSTTLKVHMRIHTGERPFNCNICNKSFSQTGPFSVHMNKHNKEKNNTLPQPEMMNDDKIIQYL